MSSTAIAIAYGLVTAACFGTGDYLAQRATHRHGWFVAVLAVQVIAALLLGASAWAWLGAPRLGLGAQPWSMLGVLGLVNTVAIVGLYRALESGKLSLVSPIAGSMGAFSVAFAWLLGTPPAVLLVPGLVLVVLGIVVASVTRDELEPTTTLAPARGVGWALLSAVGFGWVFLELGPVSEQLGAAWVVFGLRAVAIATLMILALSRRPTAGSLRELLREHPWRLLAVALFDSAGMLLFAYGTSSLHGREIVIVAVLASCFPVITIAWAQLRLHEQLRWWQWLGIATLLLGIVWISSWSDAP